MAERRKAGSGYLYQRGKTWWAKFHVNGTPVRFSTRETDRESAELVFNAARHKMGISGGVKAVAEMRAKLPRSGYGAGRCFVGAAAELLVAADLMNRGYEVYRALSQHASCDLLALGDGGQTIRVEVKASTRTVFIPRRKQDRFDILACVGDRGISYRPDPSDWPPPAAKVIQPGLRAD